jgi:hypothetical protein
MRTAARGSAFVSGVPLAGEATVRSLYDLWIGTRSDLQASVVIAHSPQRRLSPGLVELRYVKVDT